MSFWAERQPSVVEYYQNEYSTRAGHYELVCVSEPVYSQMGHVLSALDYHCTDTNMLVER